MNEYRETTSLFWMWLALLLAVTNVVVSIRSETHTTIKNGHPIIIDNEVYRCAIKP